MTVQTQVMRKIYDPEKVKEEVMAEIAAHRKEQKRGVKSTTLKVKDEKTGEIVEKNVSASEMNKRRLEYARQLDEEKYKDCLLYTSDAADEEDSGVLGGRRNIKKKKTIKKKYKTIINKQNSTKSRKQQS